MSDLLGITIHGDRYRATVHKVEGSSWWVSVEAQPMWAMEDRWFPCCTIFAPTEADAQAIADGFNGTRGRPKRSEEPR